MAISRTFHTSVVVLVAWLSAAGLVACGGREAEPVVGEGSGKYPSETLEDWKSYADHVAVFTVASERALPVSPESAEVGEGLVGRTVSLQVEEVLWSAAKAPKLPPEVTMTALGWVLDEGERRGEFRIAGAPRLEVGNRYLSPIVWHDDAAPPEWGALAQEGQFRVVDGRVAANRGENATPLADELRGRTIAEVAAAVRGQKPHPLAEKYADLRPKDRIQQMVKDGAFRDEPAP